mgnify:CR=1 FL=1
MENAIVIKSLRKEFGAKTAVRDISLSVKEGMVFSLLGVNGAGKTTTIRMLSGLSKPTSGDAFIYGKSILKDMNEIKKFSNLSPQETSIAPNLTVEENILLPTIIAKKSESEYKENRKGNVETYFK